MVSPQAPRGGLSALEKFGAKARKLYTHGAQRHPLPETRLERIHKWRTYMNKSNGSNAVRRLSVPFVFVTALAIAAALSPVTSASANTWRGWAASHGTGATTLERSGSGVPATVTQLRVGHDHGLAPENVCKYQAKVWGKLYSGSSYSKTFGYNSGCTFHGFQLSTSPNLKFDVGAWIYGQAYDAGAWAPGVPKVTSL